MRRLGCSLFFIGLASGMLMVVSSVQISGIFQIVWCALIAATLLGYGLIAVLMAMNCPRCGKRFHSRNDHGMSSFNSFAQECMNCGLRLDAKNAVP